MLKSNTLLQARPGKKHIVVKDKQGGFDFITETLEKELVSQNKSQNGAFVFMRADRGKAAHPLLLIPML